MIQARDLDQAEARLPRWMAVAAVLGTLAVLVSGRGRTAAGFALGAGLAMVNYYWLHQAIDTLFSLDHPKLQKLVVLKFLMRYPLVFAGLYVFYHTGWLPFAAILAGLFVPVAAVLMEAVVQIRAGLKLEGTDCDSSVSDRLAGAP
jgi:hypothetical protein